MSGSFIKWAGGKSWLSPSAGFAFEQSGCEFIQEIFGGSCALSLGIEPVRAVINDSCADLINMYRMITLGGFLKYTPFDNTEESYYSVREIFNESLGLNTGSLQVSAFRAWCFYWMNRTGFRGLCRYNSKGLFNVPYGFYKKPIVTADWDHLERLFENWAFTCLDFQSVVLRPGAFLYADPPYDHNGDGFTTYDGTEFTWKHQEILAEMLTTHDGPVVASNLATDRMVKLYTDLGFDVYGVIVPRKIAANGNRRPVEEMLALRGIGVDSFAGLTYRPLGD